MCATLTLPVALTPEEERLASAMESRAVTEARERAALAIRVDREHRRLMREDGHSYNGALDSIARDRRFPVSRETARRIVQKRGAWAV